MGKEKYIKYVAVGDVGGECAEEEEEEEEEEEKR